MKSIKLSLIIAVGLILVGGVGYWLYQVSQGEAVTVLECIIAERAPEKLYVKLKSVGGKPLRVTKININGWVNYTFLESIIVPPGSTVAILIPDTYAGGKIKVKTLEGEQATGDGFMVVVEGTWPWDVDPDEPWKPTTPITYGGTMYGSEDQMLWHSESVNKSPDLPEEADP